MLEYKKHNNILEINNKQINLDSEIDNVILYDNLLIVRLYNSMATRVIQQPFNNIYAFNEKAAIIWRINDIIKQDTYYGIMRLNENNNLVVVDPIGINYTIDIRKREVLNMRGQIGDKLIYDIGGGQKSGI
ncbi:hypothetical protein SAMN02745823_00644 [Sporobacter termitidis DSM 10068]|uniref:Uncharacterized protein n=1 Tax=Sporobacter termitidis DSM 10068 TaxID=1123282 RepID=A0A1M5URG7_9FIRM|nr:hypothetical protein [Sporobacter termitidis]SHH65551.1 hypothetical protein SAMN02745823_00644 [Sporobacter termitidis DSM 10068]